MKLINIFQILCCCFLCINITAQEFKNNVETKPSNKLTGLRTGIYLENGLHPGLKLGTSYILKEKVKPRKHTFKFRQNKYGDKHKQIQYLADGNIGFYNHPNNHRGAFIGVGVTRLRTKTRKMKTLGWSFEVNYLRRFYKLETYELNEDGTTELIKGAGSNSLMFALSPSWGKVFGTKNGGEGWHLYVKPSLQMLKYNHAFFPNAALEIGINLNIL